MEFTKILCRLCLGPVDDIYENLQNIERTMIRVVVPQMNLNLGCDTKICQICWRRLLDSYEFKCACIENIDLEKNFVISELLSEEHYLDYFFNRKFRIPNLEFNKLDVESVCSLCLDNVFAETAATRVPFNFLFEKCLPEVLDFPNSLGACNQCLLALESQYNFISRCMCTEEKIKYFLASNKRFTEQTNITQLACISSDAANNNFEIYQNEVQKRVAKANSVSQKWVGMKHHVTLRNLLECGKKEKTGETKDNEDGIGSRNVREFPEQQSPHPTGYDILRINKIYKCNLCDFQVSHKSTVGMHVTANPAHRVLPRYRCGFCPFASASRDLVAKHAERYADRARMFRCGVCGHATHRRSLLSAHMVIHRDASEVKMHYCDLCKYSTKRSSDLKRHKFQKHRDKGNNRNSIK